MEENDESEEEEPKEEREHNAMTRQPRALHAFSPAPDTTSAPAEEVGVKGRQGGC